jgi:hypothetical protein
VNQNDNESSGRDRLLGGYLKVASLKGDSRKLASGFLIGALWWAIATPAMFFAEFGSINWFAISVTIFVVALHLLFALGLYFLTKTQYHTAVPLRGGLADRIGAFWLVACAFGPFIGWIVTVFGVTESSWRWQYLARVLLAAALPVITAAPLVTYARGKAALEAVPLLIIITALPISSCFWVIGDLHDGAKTVHVEVLPMDEGQAHCRSDEEKYADLPCEEVGPAQDGDRFVVIWLPHTGRVLARDRIMH